MGAASPDSGDLIEVEPARPGSPVAVVTINRPAALNALTKPMMISLAAAFRRLGADDSVAAVVLAGRGRAFCSGVDLTAAEEVFKGDVKDVTTDPVAQMELCRKPIVGAIAGFAVTAGFEIALACDILVAGRSAKFLDTHAKFGIFPSWGLSQKLSRIIGPNRAREVSLTCMPVTAEMAERWGLVNHVVDDNEVLSKAIEVAEAIARSNRNLVVLYKSVINDGFKLDLEHAQALEKERGHNYYNGMTKEQFAISSSATGGPPAHARPMGHPPPRAASMEGSNTSKGTIQWTGVLPTTRAVQGHEKNEEWLGRLCFC